MFMLPCMPMPASLLSHACLGLFPCLPSYTYPSFHTFLPTMPSTYCSSLSMPCLPCHYYFSRLPFFSLHECSFLPQHVCLPFLPCACSFPASFFPACNTSFLSLALPFHAAQNKNRPNLPCCTFAYHLPSSYMNTWQQQHLCLCVAVTLHDLVLPSLTWLACVPCLSCLEKGKLLLSSSSSWGGCLPATSCMRDSKHCLLQNYMKQAGRQGKAGSYLTLLTSHGMPSTCIKRRRRRRRRRKEVRPCACVLCVALSPLPEKLGSEGWKPQKQKAAAPLIVKEGLELAAPHLTRHWLAFSFFLP